MCNCHSLQYMVLQEANIQFNPWLHQGTHCLSHNPFIPQNTFDKLQNVWYFSHSWPDLLHSSSLWLESIASSPETIQYIFITPVICPICSWLWDASNLMAPVILLVTLWSMGGKWPMESPAIIKYASDSLHALISFKSIMYLLLQFVDLHAHRDTPRLWIRDQRWNNIGYIYCNPQTWSLGRSCTTDISISAMLQISAVKQCLATLFSLCGVQE